MKGRTRSRRSKPTLRKWLRGGGTRRLGKSKGNLIDTHLDTKLAGVEQCHPRLGKRFSNGTCFPDTILSKGGASSGGSSQIKTKDQYTLLQQLPLTAEEKQTLAKTWLRPPQPHDWKGDPDKWLDSNNIRDVMMQYEETNPEFKFLGPYPIDFAAAADSTANSPGRDRNHCLIGEMCSLNLANELKNGKKYIGIIYNLDPHYKSGSHWVANFINIPKKTCYYFDSYGMKPPQEIYRFMQWLSIQEPKIKLGWNGRRFQKMNSECGMYCLFFIIRMLAGEDYLKFCRRAPPDRFMLDLRDWIFST